MAVSDEIKEQTAKFKDMTKEQKKDYIWTYYKWWILGTILGIYCIISIVRGIMKNSVPVYIDVVFLNSDHEEFMADYSLHDDFATEMNVDLEKEKVNIDYTITLTNEYVNQASMAGQTKLLSKYSAQQIDVCCGPEKTMNGSGSADVGGYQNFNEIFTKEELAEFEKKGYEFFVYTEKFTDDEADPNEYGQFPYKEGESYIAGIYVDNCKAITEKYAVYSENAFKISENDGRYVITIAWNTPNVDHAKEFIKFITK